MKSLREGVPGVEAITSRTAAEHESQSDDYPYDDEGPAYCHRCDCKGTIIICIDDMCRGAGECMHGDGEIICPDCKGESGDLW